MNIRRNTIANFVGQAYVMLIGIVILPFFVKHLGAEAYGLVGFFNVLQSWLHLLDMGLSPTLAREMAHWRGQERSQRDIRRLLRSLEVIFLFLGLITIALLVPGSRWIATKWLNAEALGTMKIAYCVSIMSVIMGMKWISGLYGSGIKGTEQQVWLNTANIVFASLKFLGVYVLIAYFTQDIAHFFEYQLVMAIIELTVLRIKLYHFLPPPRQSIYGFDGKEIRRVLPFTGGIAYTAAIWVLLTQLDKLTLSKFLPLSEYGYFSIAVLVANTILLLSGPISQALLPRMTMLLSSGKEDQMLKLYRKASQFTVVLIFSVTCLLAVFSNELLYAWTGSMSAAEKGGPILRWYSLGNGILAASAYQYYLQYAHGNVKMHVYFNSASVAVSVPIIMAAAVYYGAIGTAIAWFILRAASFFIWPPIVHARFAPGLHVKWLTKDVAPVAFSTTLCGIALLQLDLLTFHISRGTLFFLLVWLGCTVLTINALVAQSVRETTFRLISWAFTNKGHRRSSKRADAGFQKLS